MNLSQILNPPGSAAAPLPATNGITHRQGRSSSPSPPSLASATTVLRFDTPLSITTGTNLSRKHSNSVSVAQLEVQSSSPHSNTPNPPAGSNNNKANGGSPGTYQKIKPNETNNGYSTHTFRASAPVQSTKEPTIALSTPGSTTATTAVAPTVAGTSTTATTGGLTGGGAGAGAGSGGVGALGLLAMNHNAPQEMSSSLSTAKKKPRNQAESPSSFQDSFHSSPMEQLDSRAVSGTKKKPTRKGGRISPNQPETESQPLEIRFVMTDKDGQDRQQRTQKQGLSSTLTFQDMQGDDAADQESSLPSPTPDFDRNADGKYVITFRCYYFFNFFPFPGAHRSISFPSVRG
ncbi:hypothetical protein EDD21DRAFT_60714 [Dissophora ornata]|nr:hypothetical protein EDD21DRAFT_60714 [Dissophora ornata]